MSIESALIEVAQTTAVSAMVTSSSHLVSPAKTMLYGRWAGIAAV